MRSLWSGGVKRKREEGSGNGSEGKKGLMVRGAEEGRGEGA